MENFLRHRKTERELKDGERPGAAREKMPTLTSDDRVRISIGVKGGWISDETAKMVTHTFLYIKDKPSNPRH
jgi:hypothetical protein